MRRGACLRARAVRYCHSSSPLPTGERDHRSGWLWSAAPQCCGAGAIIQLPGHLLVCFNSMEGKWEQASRGQREEGSVLWGACKPPRQQHSIHKRPTPGRGWRAAQEIPLDSLMQRRCGLRQASRATGAIPSGQALKPRSAPGDGCCLEPAQLSCNPRKR